MSKLNNFINSILSWVDSHIIDYPRAIIFFRFLGNLTRITKITILVFFVSLCLLFFASVFFANLLLLVFSLYLLYKQEYKLIIIFWVSFFFLWYLVFVACLISYDGPIIFRPELGGYYIFEEIDTYNETIRLFFFLDMNNIPLKHFCMETFGVLGGISVSWNITIYVPSIFKAILALFELFYGGSGGKGGPVKCSPEENSPHDSPPSPSTPFPSRRNHWGTKPPWNNYSSDTNVKDKEYKFDTPTPSPIFKSIFKSVFGFGKTKVSDAKVCEELSKRLHKKQGLFDAVNSESTVVKGRNICYVEIGSYWDKSSFCANTKASADDILKEKLSREFKKNEKKGPDSI